MSLPASPSQIFFADCPSPTLPLDGAVGGFPVLPRPSVIRDKSALRQLELALAMAKAELEEELNKKRVITDALCKAELNYQQLQVDCTKTVDSLTEKHQRDLADFRAQTQLTLDAQAAEVCLVINTFLNAGSVQCDVLGR
jgi:hypothetical protein